MDFSGVVIDYMKQKHKMYEEMDYALMDITMSPDIMPESFNLIFDKGTLDCVACNEVQTQKKIEAMLQNIYRILAPGGNFICVSRGTPETRLLYFTNSNFNWNVETQRILKRPVTNPKAAMDGEDINQAELFDRIDQEPYYYIYIC